jgi:hypothetical protein
MGYIRDMERISKSIILEKPLADLIQRLADQERRSFTRQVEVILTTALKRQGSPRAAMQKTGD